MKAIYWLLFLALAANVRAAGTAKTNSPPEDTNVPTAKRSEVAAIPDATHQPVFTTNTVVIAGQRLTYVAETGMLPILKPDGTSSASVFYVAYTRAGQSDAATRPVMFCFNGGPVRLQCGCISARSVRAA
jgi:carboxypeptidase C (cathepsin A)